jgi:hypothetical protein
VHLLMVFGNYVHGRLYSLESVYFVTLCGKRFVFSRAALCAVVSPDIFHLRQLGATAIPTDLHTVALSAQ